MKAVDTRYTWTVRTFALGTAKARVTEARYAAQKKAVAERGDIRPLPKTCGTAPHGIAIVTLHPPTKKINYRGNRLLQPVTILFTVKTN
jgi:hypothetical protein